MLNPLNFLSKLIKSSNQKELDKISKIVKKVNNMEESTKSIQDIDFPKKTIEFKDFIDMKLKEENVIVKATILKNVFEH